MAAVGQSIDDLFRQKSLQEIHAELRKTRDNVEAKKRELRELVGDHYRSVLESSDHIRSMSECAVKVSVGAERVDELIASMRTLAANPPAFPTVATAGSPTSTASLALADGGVEKPASDENSRKDTEYLVGKHVMELLEVPEAVREHLSDLQFVQAARVALVDAASLKEQVDKLLHNVTKSPDGVADLGKPGGFDYETLVRQQTATFRCLPRQIAASCLDAFAAASLRPSGAAEGFVVHLLLEPSAHPVQLLGVFLDRRAELLRGLLDILTDDTGAALDASGGYGARLAEAAMAFEGTVFLSGCLCRAAANGVGAPMRLIAALDAVMAGTGDSSAAEERAAIEGRALDIMGVGTLRRRADSLRAQLEQGGASTLASKLAEVGCAFAEEWAPDQAGAVGLPEGAGKSLRARFSRLVSAACAGGQLTTCAALSEAMELCKQRVLAYRHELSSGPAEAWGLVWREACAHFCPGRAGPLDDALAIVASTVEKACAGIVSERIGDLQLQLVSEEDSDPSAPMRGAADADPASCGAAGGREAQQREEIAELRRRSRATMSSYNELLGEVMADISHIARGGEAPVPVTRALLAALQTRLAAACEKVPLPDVSPLWQGQASAESRSAGRPDAAPWSLQRGAARAAIALDVLLLAATDSKAPDAGPSHLQQALDSALASGIPDVATQAQTIVNNLRHHSSKAYCVWARLGVLPQERASTLYAFWQLADDEVPPTCGWGSAKFIPKGDSGAHPAGGSEAKAVPIPVQVSPVVLERAALGARRATEVSSSTGSMSHALVTAVKVALSEAFMDAYEAERVDLEGIKRAGMSHLLQLLFDLRFLRIALAAGPPPGAVAGAKAETSAAYEALKELEERVEAVTLSDPVDRLLYQDTLKSSVKSHIEGVKVLLAPLFLYNPRYGFLIQSSKPAADKGGAGLCSDEGAGFELQAAFAPPLRPALPRFPLLPVAMASTLAYTSSADLDARLGLSAAAMDRAAARAASATGGAGGPGAGLGFLRDAAGSATSLVGGMTAGLGGMGFGKALGGMTAGLGFQGGGARPPEAV